MKGAFVRLTQRICFYLDYNENEEIVLFLPAVESSLFSSYNKHTELNTCLRYEACHYIPTERFVFIFVQCEVKKLKSSRFVFTSRVAEGKRESFSSV